MVNGRYGLVQVVDATTYALVDTIAVGTRPGGVVVSPDGTRLYVPEYDANDVAVIDTATDTVLTTVAAGGGPTDVALTPDGTRAYVTDTTSNEVSVIDTATNTVVASVPANAPVAVAVTAVPTASGPSLSCTTVTPTAGPSYLQCRASDAAGIRRVRVVDQHTHLVEQSTALPCGPASPLTTFSFRIPDDGNSHRVVIADCSPLVNHSFKVTQNGVTTSP